MWISTASILTSPVTRLPQYLFFLGHIYTNSDPNAASTARIGEAIQKIQGITDDIANSLKDQVNRKLVITVQEKGRLFEMILSIFCMCS